MRTSRLHPFLLPVFFVLGTALAAEYPRPVGYVNDFAKVISDNLRAKMEAIASEVEQKTGAEIVIATVRTTSGIDIHDYSVEMFTKWGIGKKGKDNGVLIVAAIDDRRVWIKTGYGLEETLPDADASQIYRSILRPQFVRGEYGLGLLSAVQVIAGKIADRAGIKLTSLGEVSPLARDDSAGKTAPIMIPFGFAIGIVILWIVMRIAGSPRTRGRGGFPFWTMGGFSGGMKGGGFGGGFGGFGGGACGGGGAGGGW